MEEKLELMENEVLENEELETVGENEEFEDEESSINFGSVALVAALGGFAGYGMYKVGCSIVSKIREIKESRFKKSGIDEECSGEEK